MNSLPMFLKYARLRYIAYRIFLRVKIGKDKRDEFLRARGMSEIDFLPEIPYSVNGLKVLPRKGTDDASILSIPQEKGIEPHITMQRGETFVDVGANVGYYTLKIAKEYSTKGVTIIAIEAHPGNYKALIKNIKLNDLKCVTPINKAVSDHRGTATLYDRVDKRNRIRSGFYSLSNAPLNEFNVASPGGGSINVECDTIDNIVGDQKVDVMKIDIEGTEVPALEGATKTLKMVRKIIIEVHGNNLNKIRNILDDTHRFKVETLESSILNVQHLIGSWIER
jgi:FkbM family methyltransferase